MTSLLRLSPRFLGPLALAALALTTIPARADDLAAPASPPDNVLLNRGRYLVESVGLCADCHSPRNEKGEFIREHWLMGTVLPFKPAVPMPWAPAAPTIAGLPTMNDEQAHTFLTQGVRPDGSRPLPPMPEFRFSDDDARAVIAYLRSVTR